VPFVSLPILVLVCFHSCHFFKRSSPQCPGALDPAGFLSPNLCSSLQMTLESISSDFRFIFLYSLRFSRRSSLIHYCGRDPGAGFLTKTRLSLPPLERNFQKGLPFLSDQDSHLPVNPGCCPLLSLNWISFRPNISSAPLCRA